MEGLKQPTPLSLHSKSAKGKVLESMGRRVYSLHGTCNAGDESMKVKLFYYPIGENSRVMRDPDGGDCHC